MPELHAQTNYLCFDKQNSLIDIHSNLRPCSTVFLLIVFLLQMPIGSIPAITGKLRKRLILDLTVALGGGTALGYGYWYGVHIPSVSRRDTFYAKLQSERTE
ncbi:related to COX9 - Cytochrome-c oxidase chain VIIA [Ustilago bromivora]|uniref:Related to COX9 - Cytochrome-c oxidase chain VIIA n=2 Tax=Ustilago bromivora TaxID=307758 RepID=A0A8H8TUE3_9BASI|nr:related to COX9 - Cytochrome-c oxidase chain VIIA [Ustilago bromivora]